MKLQAKGNAPVALNLQPKIKSTKTHAHAQHAGQQILLKSKP